ncbi:FAD-dependent monooxygenase [Saccharomonospora sp. NPDC006951]
MGRRKSAIVIGGGIGGLSAAIGLHAIGVRVAVYERGEGTALGAGITLWPNAQYALAELGLGPRLDALYTPGTDASLKDSGGRRLTHVDEAAFVRANGRGLLGVHRAALADLLRSALPEGTVRFRSPVSSVAADGTVGFADGTTESADLVVAADGIRSTARAALWPGHAATRYTGFTAFRAVVDDGRDRAQGITLGPGTEFGSVPLTGGKRYWYASLFAPRGLPCEPAKEFLTGHLAHWHSGVRELVEATAPEAILRHDLRVLATPLPSFVSGKVAVLGDAAHAMTPFLGQGGCQAIEDAVVLAASVDNAATIEEALCAYDAERRPRTDAITRASAMTGLLNNRPRNRVVVALRDGLLRATNLLPESARQGPVTAVTGWRPPALPRRR